eukprot:TRINITY_DN23823_c0_g1_i1.p1 TRINITY_DN23823_c0_g1~~TRINITY_DN23823_c0_g1_i1.p1  ORF type:complete len:111 (-),score=10.66 TRINITY_DN23823_c0_g1_i1:386-718(-)
MWIGAAQIIFLYKLYVDIYAVSQTADGILHVEKTFCFLLQLLQTANCLMFMNYLYNHFHYFFVSLFCGLTASYLIFGIIFLYELYVDTYAVSQTVDSILHVEKLFASCCS